MERSEGVSELDVFRAVLLARVECGHTSFISSFVRSGHKSWTSALALEGKGEQERHGNPCRGICRYRGSA